MELTTVISKFEKEMEVQQEENSIQKIDNQENDTSEASTFETPQRKFRGVTFHRKNNKWIAQASHNGKSKYLGTHATAEKAARVYDAYVLTTIGADAKTNFPKEEVDLNLLPKLRSYKKQQMNEMPMYFSQNPLFNMYPHTQALHHDRKDPRHPKHPRNAYLMYVAERRKRIKVEGMKTAWNGKGNMHKVFAQEWKNLPEMERLTFQKLAEQDRSRYEAEMQNYEDPNSFSYLQSAMPNPFGMMARGPNGIHGFPPPMANLAATSSAAAESPLGITPVSGNAAGLDANKHLSMNMMQSMYGMLNSLPPSTSFVKPENSDVVQEGTGSPNSMSPRGHHVRPAKYEAAPMGFPPGFMTMMPSLPKKNDEFTQNSPEINLINGGSPTEQSRVAFENKSKVETSTTAPVLS